MKFKKQIGYFLTSLCMSFTIVMLMYTALSGVMDAPVNSIAVYSLFAICAMVSFMVRIVASIPINNIPLAYFINFMTVFLTVFIFGGGVLGVFPFKWNIMLIVFGMSIAAYIGVVILLLATEQITALNINKKIAEMKRKNHKEEK